VSEATRRGSRKTVDDQPDDGGEEAMSEWMVRYWDAWNSHDANRVAEMMAETVTFIDIGLGTTYQGRDAVRAFAAQGHETSEDSRFTLRSSLQSGSTYAMEWESIGTNTGPLGPLPATNKTYRVHGASIGEVDENGLVLRNTDYWNMADFLVQLEILPSLT
jgi:steroid delta-isomerase-like uncharacterized protein